ncbi:MAG: protein kinase, partial [Anaerolineales bacterium]
MEIPPDTLLRDRYRIIRPLGKGGMGAVYLAYDTSLDTQVAVKTNINPGPHSTRQFLREARLLASLRHPNL